MNISQIIAELDLPKDFSNTVTNNYDIPLLQNIVKQVRILGIGESAHFVKEFNLCRVKLAHFLIETCNFTHIALEIGKIEATKLNPWLQGKGEISALSSRVGTLTYWLYGNLLYWLRNFNATRKKPIIVLGPDLPNDMNLLLEVEKVINFLEIPDPQLAALLIDAKNICKKIPHGSAAVAAPEWNKIDNTEKNLLTYILTKTHRRMEELGPHYLAKSDSEQYYEALYHIKTASDVEYMFRTMAEIFSGDGLVADTSIRETFAAKSLLDSLSADATMRILFMVHNNHIQKMPVMFGEYLAAYPMGFHLAQALGKQYRAIGLTHVDNKVPDMIYPVPESPVGFEVEMVNVDLAPEKSIENFAIQIGLSSQCTLFDLTSNIPSITELSSMRSQSAFISAKLVDTFDAVITIPNATQDVVIGTFKFIK